MIIDVNGSSGTYKVDTDNVTCTCRNFIYKKKGIPIDDSNRLCKHLKSLAEEHPEYFPNVVIKSLNTLNEVETHVGIVRSEFLTTAGIVKNLLEDALDSSEVFDYTGDFRLGIPRIDQLEFLVGMNQIHSIEFNQAMIEALRIQVTRLTETQYELIFKSDGYKRVLIHLVQKREFPFRQLFLTGTKSDVLELVNKSYDKGLNLTMTGFNIDIDSIKSESDIYKYLGIPYPDNRKLFDTLIVNDQVNVEDFNPF